LKRVASAIPACRNRTGIATLAGGSLFAITAARAPSTTPSLFHPVPPAKTTEVAERVTISRTGWAYLAATLRGILDGHPKTRIEELMPWRLAQPSSFAA
jgi:hypothetical protein